MHRDRVAIYYAALVVVCLLCSGHGRHVQANFQHRPPTEVEKRHARCGQVGQANGCKAKNPASAFKAVTEFLLAQRPGHAFIPHGETVSSSWLQSRSKARTPILMAGNSPMESDLESDLESSRAKKLKLEAEIAALEEKRLKLELEALEKRKVKLEAGVSASSVASGTSSSSSSSPVADDVIINVKKPELQPSQPSSQSEEPAVSEAPLNVGTTRTEFLEFIKETAEQRRAKNPECMQQIVANALDAGREIQRKEIEQLRNLLEKPTAKGLFPPKSELLKVPDLISKAQNPGLKPEESRAFARDTFKFLAALNEVASEEPESPDEEKIPVPGRGLVPSSALRQRLQRLEQHEAAGCVEYRLFAVALSDGSLEEALGSCFVEDREKRMIGSSAFFARVTGATRGAQGAPPLMPMPGMAIQQPNFAMSFGTPPNFAMGSGTPDLADMENSVLSSWLEPLADMISRTNKLPSENPMGMPPGMPPGMFAIDVNQMASDETNIFPLFLTFLGGSQGNFEPLIVYYLARLVGRYNVQAVARSEARVVPLKPDAIFTEQESKYLSKVQREAFEDAGGALQASLGIGLVLSTAFSLFVAYAVFSTLYGLVSGIFTPPPVDPLNF